ncbi:MAG: hypothetical protein HY615_10165 [Candidatus Rokubacteria bacterium]|nr:hypothetical protein [Candidatus Rokubacteria bacterium]
MILTENAYAAAQALVAARLGLSFPAARRPDLERGLAGALRGAHVRTVEPYLARLAAAPADDPEWRRLAAHLTVGETYFFRDAAAFGALERHVLPELIAGRRARGDRRLRLWSAACATGEEAYTLAILLDRLLPDLADWTVTLLATDLSTRRLEAARRGRYRAWSLRETPAWARERYFRPLRTGELELDARLRARVTFAPLNLAADDYPSVLTNTTAMDLILCRNAIMYFTEGAQRATAARLVRALGPEGWLVTSAAEASTDLLAPLVAANLPDVAFYRKTALRAAALPAPGPSAPLPPLAPPVPRSAPPLAVAPARRRAGEGAAPTLVRARALADQGSLDEARRECKAVLARERLSLEAHLLLAAIEQERGELDGALDALRRALYLAPDSAAAHFLLGTLLIRRGERRRGRRAMETVRALLERVPRDEPLPGSDGLTAGRLLETARAHLAGR